MSVKREKVLAGLIADARAALEMAVLLRDRMKLVSYARAVTCPTCRRWPQLPCRGEDRGDRPTFHRSRVTRGRRQYKLLEPGNQRDEAIKRINDFMLSEWGDGDTRG